MISHVYSLTYHHHNTCIGEPERPLSNSQISEGHSYGEISGRNGEIT